MRILFYTHRFGKDVVGGAERHLWKLAEQMTRMGCAIDVVTTREVTISPVMRFGLTWSDPADSQTEEHEVEPGKPPVRVFRFPARNLPKPLAGLLQKYLQKRWEQEELAMEPGEPLPTSRPTRKPLLLTGWHLPETVNSKTARWTMGRATLQIPETQNASLHFSGEAPRHLTIAITHAGRRRVVYRGRGEFHVPVRLDDAPAGIVALEIDPVWRPLRDTRTLGVRVNQVSFSNRGRIELAPFNSDHRTIRAQRHTEFIDTYRERALARPLHYGWIFDLLRGPWCPGMERFLKEHGGEYDWVIAGILPFRVIPRIHHQSFRQFMRLALLPLFHVDDDFYYWRHYFDAMQAADTCLANSWFSHENFFPRLGAHSIMAGAGVDEKRFRSETVSGNRFRKRYGIDSDEAVILSVGRKSATKQYGMIIRAVDNIQHRVACRFVLVGPDEDHLAITSPNCRYLGTLPRDDILDAYDACDIFCLMSDSESFGMVFVEAWMREKPVVGNATCAPVAHLIQHGENGLLVQDQSELEQALLDLLADREKRRAFGHAGYELAHRRHTWPVIARRILDRLNRESPEAAND